MRTGSKSSRMRPAEGLRCLISAINRLSVLSPSCTTARKKFRGRSITDARCLIFSNGVRSIALATSTRFRAMIVSRPVIMAWRALLPLVCLLGQATPVSSAQIPQNSTSPQSFAFQRPFIASSPPNNIGTPPTAESSTGPEAAPGAIAPPIETAPAQPIARADDGWIAALIILALAALAIALFIRKRWYRLPREPLAPPAFTPAVGLALYLGMFFASTIGGIAAIHIFNLETETTTNNFEDAALLRFGSYLAQSIIAIVYAWLVFEATRGATYISKRPTPAKSAVLAVLALLVCWPVAQAISMFIAQ